MPITIDDYDVFKIPKRKGGFRTIEAPKDYLKEKQEDILERLYQKVPVSPFCHGGVPFRSIVTNAYSHVKQDVVASVDIVNFFPNTSKQLVMERLRKLTDDENLIKDVENYCFLEDRLPQGAPTSPYLANIALIDFDWFMARFCCVRGIQYTRYFDDITISGKKSLIRIIGAIIRTVIPEMIYRYGRYKVHKEKIITAGRKMVCGVVVNEKLNVPRKYRRRLRAEIHQKGLNNATTLGKYNFVRMVREADTSNLKTSCELCRQWFKDRIAYSILTENKIKRYLKNIITESLYYHKHYKLDGVKELLDIKAFIYGDKDVI